MIIRKPSSQPRKRPNVNPSSSWESVHPWYNKTVGEEGHYYHQNVIFPKLLKHLESGKKPIELLDLACGQGVLSRQLPQDATYVGIDLSPSLIKSANRLRKNDLHSFHVGDITKPFPIKKNNFTHATIILALQNVENPEAVLRHAGQHLQKGGKIALVLNHPYFRIPRQSSWGVDESKKVQYRRVDQYLSPMKIPIVAHPGQKQDHAVTYSYHFPLSNLTEWLKKAGFRIEAIEEWCSDKVSTGSKAKMEDKARNEFPLFMAVFAEKH